MTVNRSLTRHAPELLAVTRMPVHAGIEESQSSRWRGLPWPSSPPSSDDYAHQSQATANGGPIERGQL